MIIDGIAAGISGMNAAVRRLNQSANNLANISTPGYVPSRVEQADLAGGGVAVVGQTALASGPIVSTGNALDLAIDGAGYFVLQDADGNELYTRAGNFSLNADGQLVDQTGRLVQAEGFQAPQGTAQIQVGADGVVQALGADDAVLAEGQLQIATFANPGGLQAVGGNAFQATDASGPAVIDAAGQPGYGAIASGALQTSGTDIVSEMVGQITAQRSFEANLKTIRTGDEMLGTILDIVG